MFVEPTSTTSKAGRRRTNSAGSRSSVVGQTAGFLEHLAHRRDQSDVALFETEMTTMKTDSAHWYDDPDEDEPFFDKDEVYRILDGEHLSWKRRFQDIFDGTPHRRDVYLHIAINAASVLAIIASCITFCMSTLPQYLDARSGKGLDISNSMFWIDTACVMVFVAELGLRIGVRHSWESLLDIFFAIDLIAILGYVVDVLTDILTTTSGAVAFVRLLRLFRVFRIFKLSRHSKSLQLVVLVLKKSAGGLTVLTLPLLIVTLCFGSIIFFFEVLNLTWDPTTRTWRQDNGRPGQFQSIPDAIWFTASTITTVGFGDIVPISIPGQIFAVMACFLGILILSFPNIVLGGNLQFAFRAYYRLRARKILGRKFRKVYHCVAFCLEVKRLAEERAAMKQYDAPQQVDGGEGPSPNFLTECVHSDEGSAPLSTTSLVKGLSMAGSTIRLGKVTISSHISGGQREKKVSVNYLASKQELEMFKKPGVELITDENIRSWKLNDFSAVALLKRLLELCSGVGTVQELHESFARQGQAVHSVDIALTALYLMEAEFLQLFVFRRGATNMLVSLTPKSCTELLVHGEEAVVDCIRSVDVARLLWKRSTNVQPLFSLHLLLPSYPIWAATEKMVENNEHTPNVDYKITFWKLSDKLGGGSKRASNVAPRLSVAALAQQASNVKLEEAKEVLREILRKQQERIRELVRLVEMETQAHQTTFQ